MRNITMSGAAACDYKPPHPERTSVRCCKGLLNFDQEFKEWSSRAAMALAIRMQEKREYRQDDWRAVEKLSPGEGY